MAETCLVCLRPLPGKATSEYHGRCAGVLFGSRRLPKLEVDPRNLHLLGLEMAGRVSLSGVQRKLALGLERGALRVLGTSGGEFILKPPSEEYPDLPQNEQLCVRLARAVGLGTPPTGLVRLADGSLAFLSRRFDRQDGRRLPVEDFCQLAEKLPRDKYTGSYEQCARLLRIHSDEWLADGAELFRLVLFSWWVGNGDLHLKNLSLLGEQGRHRLSPCYDLVSTLVAGLDDRMALTIGGRHSRIRPSDWIQLGDRAGLSPRAMEREARRMVTGVGEALPLLSRVPMRSDLVARFLKLLRERMGPLVEIWEAAAAGIEKPTKSVRAPLIPTGKTALGVVQRIRGGLEDIGLQEGSPLDEELHELEWLARDEGAIFRSDGPYSQDPERTTRAFLRMLRLSWVAWVLDRARAIPGSEGARKHLRRLSSRPDGTLPGEAGDHLLELEVAAALDATGRLKVRMGDTDIEILDPSGVVIGLECKRPGRKGRVSRSLHEAIQQLEARGRPGFVIISLTELLPSTWIVGADRSAALEDAGGSLAALLGPLQRELGDRFARSGDPASLAPGTVLGAVFTADVVIATRDSEAGGYVVRPHTITRTLTNPHHPELERLVELLAISIASGADRLQG